MIILYPGDWNTSARALNILKIEQLPKWGKLPKQQKIPDKC